MEKYYVFKFNKTYGFRFKKAKCTDMWNTNAGVCWQFSKQGAKRIAERKNALRKNDIYIYGIVKESEVDKMLADYEKALDKETYMSEMMNERPSWI